LNPGGPALLGARVLPLADVHGGGLEAELSLRVPSSVVHIDDAVRLVVEHVESRFADPHSVRFNVRVALCEALANAILYGNRNDPAKTVDLRARYGPRTVEIHVTDEGPGFDPETVPDPTLPENLERADGRGVFLIRRLMDEVRFNEKGNSVCMILRRS
jgi:serine/threonine-protein kinase RsbW